jgi:hypothetical protein
MEYLTRTRGFGPHGENSGGSVASVDTALDWAEVAAMLGDFHEAVSWLEYVEWLSGTLPPELAELRKTWAIAAGLDPS